MPAPAPREQPARDDAVTGAAIARPAAVAAVALLAAACGAGPKDPGVAGGGRTAQHAQLESQYLSFAKCMRSNGVSDFPDPVTGSGGHPGFLLQGDMNSNLNSNNPAFQRGVEACQHILGHRFEFSFLPSGVGKGA
jgi:hypothetical protein